jgi:GT2 family glycosyltransferase
MTARRRTSQRALTGDDTPVRLTVAVLDHARKGYPTDCLRSYGLDRPEPGVETLLVDARPAEAPAPFGHVRRVRVSDGGRAAAKNRALAEARGAYIALVASDTLGEEGTLGRLLDVARQAEGPVAVAAQLLLESGRWCPTDFAYPSIGRELNILRRPWRLLRRLVQDTPLPLEGGAFAAASVRADCLLAGRDVFERAGRFEPGYRFGVEDAVWCRRAQRAGAGVLVLPAARATTIRPRRFGYYPVAAFLAADRSCRRFVRATQGPLAGLAYSGVRTLKCAVAWPVLAFLHGVTFGAHPALRREFRVATHTLFGGGDPDALPPDIASHMWWERLF